MKIGLAFSNIATYATPDGARALAAAAEQSGLESLWTVEHTVVPDGYESKYPYSSSGRMPGPENSPIPDPLIWLSWMAALTSNVRLGTGILILPQRNPVILAKEVASLDVLSGGRMMLGVGIGWLKEEFDAIGVPFKTRVSRTEESIAALRALWSEEETHNGKHFSFTKAHSNPKPVSGSIPIHVGGHSVAAAQRAARLADGFFPSGSEGLEAVNECRRYAEELGRDPGEIEFTVGGRGTPEEVEQYTAAGVHRMVIPPPSFDPSDIGDKLSEIVKTLS